MARDIDAEEDTPVPENDAHAKLKLVAHYAMLGFAPVISIVALGVALFATGNHSDRAQISELNSRVEKLSASLSASREELENLKFSMSREKSQRSDERKKEEERDTKIIQNVTRLQEKLKIVPTLEEQLRAPASARTEAFPVAASAPVAAGRTQAATAPVPASAAPKPAAATPTPKVDEKKKDAAVPAKKAEEKKKAAPPPKPAEKLSPQVQGIKNAIEQYNKQ